MSRKAALKAEDYTVKERVERDTADAETGLNDQQEESDGLKIEGLALPFGKRSRNGVVYEKESVKKAADTLVGSALLFNHDEDNPIGHIEDVEVTDDGLRYFGDLNTERREVDSLERGDIPHVSVLAMVEETENTRDTGEVAVTEFLEMSAVTVPGFSQTDVNTSETVMIEKLVTEEEAREKLESLEDPQFREGDFVRWDFSGGSADGEVYDMTTEVGDQMSAGGNTFEIEEGDGPLYKMQEWDDEQEEFTNAVVKFEDALREVERPEEAPSTAPRNESTRTEQDWKVHTPAYDSAVKTNWDGVDREEFDSDEEFRSVHIVEHGDEVHLPVSHKEEGELRLVYEALNSAHDLAENIEGIPEQTVDNARDVLEMLREDEFPEEGPLDADQSEMSKVERAKRKAKVLKKKNEALEDVDLTPPDKVVNAAELGLEKAEELDTDCGTGVGDDRAERIVNGNLRPEDFLGGENTAIPDYLESHSEDVTAEGPPTDWSNEEWSDCGNLQYAKWGFYLEWFVEKEQELQEEMEEILQGEKSLTEQNEEQSTTTEQLEEVAEDDFTGTVADMYEDLSASDAASLMEEFEFSGDPEPLVAQVADAANMTPSDLMEVLEAEMESTHGDDDDDMEDEESDMDDEDDDMEESESSDLNESEAESSQDGEQLGMSDTDNTSKSREELENRIEELEEQLEKLEPTEESKQVSGTSGESKPQPSESVIQKLKR